MNTFPSLEVLECRIAPATLILVEGTLVYSAGNNIANDLTFDIVGSNIVITDNAETINVAQAAGFVLSNGNKTATGPGGSVASISLIMGNGADTVRIFGAEDQMNVSGSGTLAVTIGDGTCKDIKNIIDIDGTGSGADSILVNSATEASSTTVTVSANGIGGAGDTLFGALGQVGFNGIESITVRTGTANSTVKVPSTGAGTSTTITSASFGTDTVLIGSAGSMQGILGQVTVSNPLSFSNLTLDNSADTIGRNVTITAAAVTGLAPAAVNFVTADIGGLTVLNGGGADTISVTGMQSPGVVPNTVNAGGGSDVINITAMTEAATFLGGAGADTFNVGSGDLNAITTSLVLQGGGDAGDALILNDATSAAVGNYAVTSTVIDRATFGSANYSGFTAITLNAKTGNNGIDIASTAAGAVLTINGNSGDDTFTLGATVNTLNGIVGALVIDGGAQSTGDSLVVNDTAETVAHTYTLAGTSLARDGAAVVTSFSGIEGMGIGAGSRDDTVDASGAGAGINFRGGDGNDRFTGSPFTDVFFGEAGMDTFTSVNTAGDATVTATGVVYSGGNNDAFPGSDVEVVRIVGDAGVNHFDATTFPGFAILDGVSGKDAITGSDVVFGPKSVTLKDADGDTVTIKSSKSRIGAQHLGLAPANATGASVQAIDLLGDPAFNGAVITVTAKASASGGDSFVNVGFLNAEGIDLGGVTIAGDLGRIVAGDSDSATTGLGKLTVGSLYAYGPFTQAAGGSNLSVITGKLGALAARSSFGAGSFLVDGVGTAGNGSIGAVKIGGNHAGLLKATGGITSVTITKSLAQGSIVAGGAIGAVKIGGDLSGTIAAGVSAGFVPATQAQSVVLKSLTVGGDARSALVLAGGVSLAATFNADASIGAITVIGDWVQSSVSAGVSPMNGQLGDAGDTIGTAFSGQFNGMSGGNPAIVATIASITIKGQVAGTFPAVNGADQYGFVAQQITSFKIGAAKLPLTKNSTDTPISIGPTGDATIREVP